MKKCICFRLIILFILLVSTFSAFSSNMNVREYLEGKFPAIYMIYLASLETLDADEIEFLDLLKELPENRQRVYVREVYQDGFSPELLERLKNRPEEALNLFLKVAYPSQKEQMIWKSPLYVFGSTTPSTNVVVTVNGEKVALFDSRTGNFLTLVEIPEGNSLPIVITASSPQEKISIQKTVIYPKVWEEMPISPLSIHAKRMQPQENQMLREGDKLRVMFQGSPQAQAMFRIGDNPDKIFMQELNDSTLPLGGKGIYKGSYTVKKEDLPPFGQTMGQTIVITLKRGAEEVSRELPGKVSFSSKLPLRVVEIVDKKTRIHRVKEESFAYLGSTLGGDGLPTELLGYSLLPGTIFEVTGMCGEYMRVTLGQQNFLIHRDDVAEINQTEKPFSKLSKIMINETSDEVVFRFDTRQCIPFLLQDERQRLRLFFYGVKSSEDIKYETDSPAGLPYVKTITTEPLLEEGENVLVVTMDFYHPVIGFDYWWDKTELVIRIRKSPEISRYNPLQGRTIVIDPGHGGNQCGAIGPGDVHEKDVVLQISRFLKDMLEEKGVKVIMTRDEDITLQLDKRIEIALKNNADLFLSIHANAHAVGADAINYHGHMTIYNYNYNQALAQSIMDHMVKKIGLPRARVWQRSDLVVLRCPQIPSVLIETAFMMHPEDNWYLLQPVYQREFAEGIMDGIAAYFLGLQQ